MPILDAKCVGKFGHVGILQRAGDGAVLAETFLLDAPYVAIGIVVEQQDVARNVVLHCGGKFGRGEQESTVASHANDRTVRCC